MMMDSRTVKPTFLWEPPASSTAWGMFSKPHRKKGEVARMANIPPNMLLWALVPMFS